MDKHLIGDAIVAFMVALGILGGIVALLYIMLGMLGGF